MITHLFTSVYILNTSKDKIAVTVLLILLSVTALTSMGQLFDNLESQKYFSITGRFEAPQT